MKKLTTAEAVWLTQAASTAEQTARHNTKMMCNNDSFTAMEHQEAEWQSDIAMSAYKKLVLIIDQSDFAS